MKIAFINPILFTANDSRRIPDITSIKDCMIYDLCCAFKEMGHEVTLVAAEDYSPRIPEEYDFKVLFFKSRFKKLFLPDVLPCPSGFYSYLKENRARFDIVITSEVFSLYSLCAALACPRKTVIWNELNRHNHLSFKLPSLTWYNIVVPLFYRKIRRVVGRSDSARAFMARFLPQTSPIVVDHGINLNKFNHVSREKKDQFIVAAQLVKRKNIDRIITHFSKFLKFPNCSGYKLLIAGRGVLENELKDQVKALGIESSVVFLGFVGRDQLNRFIAESKASLIDSTKEMNILAIPEDIVSGTPALNNTSPAIAPFVGANNLGIAKETWDETDLLKIVENNRLYVDNCIAMRPAFSTTRCAQSLIDAFDAREIPAHPKT